MSRARDERICLAKWYVESQCCLAKWWGEQGTKEEGVIKSFDNDNTVGEEPFLDNDDDDANNIDDNTFEGYNDDDLNVHWWNYFGEQMKGNGMKEDLGN